jgi:hypothetical protein
MAGTVGVCDMHFVGHSDGVFPFYLGLAFSNSLRA